MSDNNKSEAEGGKKKGKGLLIGILAVVLAGGGGAGWFFLKPKPDPEAEQMAQYAPAKDPIFVNLDPFTVNLADDDDRMAQASIVLQMLNKNAEDDLKKHMPAVRNNLLLLLSSQQAKTVLSRQGKENLAEEIADLTSEVLGWEKPSDEPPAQESKSKTRKAVARIEVPRPVLAVHFNQFLVQ